MNAGGSTFVTGGSGVVGRAVVKHLVDAGREVRALARTDDAKHLLSQLGAIPVAGDIDSTDAMVRDMRGCESVFHIAGINAFCLKETSSLFAVNVLGSLNVVSAAARASVPRLVYTSSASTLGEKGGTVGTETSEHRGYFLSEYERSKYEAERVVLNRAAELGVDAVSVNPSSVQGPGRSGGTGRFLVMYLRGKLRFFVPTRVSIVDIDDCAGGHLLAEINGVPGERYLLNSASTPIDELLEIVRRLAGGGPVPRKIPAPVALGASAAVELAFRAVGKRPPVCREMMRTLLHGHNYDGSRAHRELGLDYTPVEATLQRTIGWLRSEGLVPG